MKNSQLTGVILAAGRGTRMYPFNLHIPKPMVPICNKPLLEYQIEAMVSIGIRRIIIVIGHLGFELTRTIGDGHRFGASIEYFAQEQILGIAHAVGQLEKFIDGRFLLSLGDIFFEFDNLDSIIQDMETQGTAAVLAVREEESPEALRKNFAVILDEAGYVRRVIEKPRFAKTKLKGCGLYLFDLPIFDAIRRTPRSAMRDEYEITDAIQILIDDEQPVGVSRCVAWDMNLTNPGDLLECNLRQMASSNFQNVIDPEARIHPGASMERSVIGRNAEICNPVAVTNSLVLPHARVVATRSIDRLIITPETVIDCRTFEGLISPPRSRLMQQYSAATAGARN
jgi:dTDP-glucose pyrophosphorylase